jgi:hypothetical protein
LIWSGSLRHVMELGAFVANDDHVAVDQHLRILPDCTDGWAWYNLTQPKPPWSPRPGGQLY